jgi:hypothetical protein
MVDGQERSGDLEIRPTKFSGVPVTILPAWWTGDRVIDVISTVTISVDIQFGRYSGI